MEQTMDELLNHTATWAKRRCSRKTGTTNISAERLPVPLMPDSVKRCQPRSVPAWHDGRRGNGFLATLLKPGNQVLEIGCSNEHISEYLQQQSCKVLSVLGS